MPITGNTTTIEENGENKEAFVVSFTNGGKQQLEELKAYFNQNSLQDVIQLGISLLQKAKEMKDKEEILK